MYYQSTEQIQIIIIYLLNFRAPFESKIEKYFIYKCNSNSIFLL